MIEKVVVAQVTTRGLSFPEDLQTYVDSEVGGIGVWEEKLGDGPDGKALERFLASGLKGTLTVRIG